MDPNGSKWFQMRKRSCFPFAGCPGFLGAGVGGCGFMFYVMFVIVGGVHTLRKALRDSEGKSDMALLEQPKCYSHDDTAHWLDKKPR